MAILIGWKQIAGYLGVGVDTAKRYVKLGMPVSKKRFGRPVTTCDIVKEWLEKEVKMDSPKHPPS